MKPAEIKKLSIKEMRAKLEELRKELLNLRLRKQAGQVEKPHRIAALRHDIARLETLSKMEPSATVN